MKLYYHLPSSKKYLSYVDALLIDSIEDTKTYLSSIVSKEDSITLFLEQSASKIILRQGNQDKSYTLEIVTPEGVLYLIEEINDDEIKSILNYVDQLENIILNPLKYGFESESL